MIDVQASPEARARLDAIAARAGGQAGGENFPVALRVLPRTPRAQLTRVYGFARFVDDIGDASDVPPGERLALLALVDEDLQALAGAHPAQLPVVAALGPVLAAGVPAQPFRDLVAANVRDQRQARYADFDDLVDYCRLSAEPVGRIVLHLAGAATPANVADSDSVCRALQILEHCQDVREDALMQRIYLPQDELRAAGVADDELRARSSPAALCDVVAAQVTRADELLRAGRPLVGRLRGWARLAVAGYVAGGLATADALRAHGHEVLAADVRPSRSRTAVHAARLLATSGLAAR